MTTRTFIQLMLMSLVVGCFKGPGFFQPRSASDAAAKAVAVQQSSGAATALFSANSSVPQTASAVGLEDVDGEASITFPAGALNTAITLKIAAASNVANNLVAEELKLSSSQSVSSAGPAVAFVPSEGVDPAKPFTLSIPVSSSSGLHLMDANTRVAIIYVCRNSKTGENYKGINFDVVVENGKATFSALLFGAFQAAYVSGTGVQDLKSSKVTTKDEIAFKHDVKNSGATMSELSGTMDANGEYVFSVTISGFNPDKCLIEARNPKSGKICGTGKPKVDNLRVYFDTSSKDGSDGHEDRKEGEGCGGGDSGEIDVRMSCKAPNGVVHETKPTRFKYTGGDRSATVSVSSTAVTSGTAYSDARNWQAFPVSGSCSHNGGKVYVYFGGVSYVTTCSNKAWSLTPNISSMLPGNYQIRAEHSNTRGQVVSSSSLPLVHGAPLFGNGADGDVSVSGTSPVPMINVVNGSSQPVFGSTRVDDASSCDGGLGTGYCQFTFGTSFISTANVTVGSELMWIVTASSASGSRSCTGDIGKYGFGRVSSVDDSGTPKIVRIVRTTLSVPATFATGMGVSDQCVMQLVRVPNIRNLDVAPDSTGTEILAPIHNWTGTAVTGSGGVLAVRVSGTLSYSGGNAGQPVSFSAVNYGFTAGTSGSTQGASEAGAGTSSTSPNGAGGGGGSAAYGGGGGAGYSAGRDGETNNSSGGAARSVLQGSSFSGGLSSRLYMGGGGAHSGATGATPPAPSAGGGIVLAFIQSVASAGGPLYVDTASITSSTTATYEGGGGGGGGSAIFATKSLQKSLTISAAGGNGQGGAFDDGGAGGGGYIQTFLCSGGGNLSLAEIIGGTDFAGTAADGLWTQSSDLCSFN